MSSMCIIFVDVGALVLDKIFTFLDALQMPTQDKVFLVNVGIKDRDAYAVSTISLRGKNGKRFGLKLSKPYV